MRKKRLETLRKLCELVADEFQMSEKDLFMTTRARSHREPRQIFHYLASRHSPCTITEIGEFSMTMGRNKPHHHASVLNSVKKIESYIEFDQDFHYTIKKLETKAINKLVGVNPRIGYVISADRQIDEVFLDSNDDFLSKIKRLVRMLCVDRIDSDIDNIISDQQKKMHIRHNKKDENNKLAAV